MKRGFIPPFPVEFFGPEDFDTINLFKVHFFATDDERKNYLSLIKDDERMLPLFTKIILGIVREKVIREVFIPQLCFPNFLLPLSRQLQKEGVKLFFFKFSPIRNSDFLNKSVVETMKYLGLSQSDMENRLMAWNTIRNSIKKVDGVQTRALALKGYAYIESFYTIMDPSLSFPQLKNIADTRIALNITSSKKDTNIRLALFEFSPFCKSFYSTLDKIGAAIVYDEFSHESFPLSHFSDVATLYSTVSFPLGMVARKDKLIKEVKDRNIDGIIYCTYNSSKIVSNANFLEKELNISVHIYEISEKEEKINFENSLLERFIKNLEEARRAKH